MWSPAQINFSELNFVSIIPCNLCHWVFFTGDLLLAEVQNKRLLLLKLISEHCDHEVVILFDFRIMVLELNAPGHFFTDKTILTFL